MSFNLAANEDSKVGGSCFMTVLIALLAINNQCNASLPGSIRPVPRTREPPIWSSNDRLQAINGASRNRAVAHKGIVSFSATKKYSVHREHQRRDVSTQQAPETGADSFRRIFNITSVLTSTKGNLSKRFYIAYHITFILDDLPISSDSNTLTFNLSRPNTTILLSKIARVEIVARFHSNGKLHRLRRRSISMTLLLLSTSKIVKRGKMHIDDVEDAAVFTLDVTGMLRPPPAPNGTEKKIVSLLSDVQFPNVTFSAVCKRRRKIKSCHKYGIILESNPILVIHYSP